MPVIPANLEEEAGESMSTSESELERPHLENKLKQKG
jgi:hypothetical protein